MKKVKEKLEMWGLISHFLFGGMILILLSVLVAFIMYSAFFVGYSIMHSLIA